jgi:hypothetical protein
MTIRIYNKSPKDAATLAAVASFHAHYNDKTAHAVDIVPSPHDAHVIFVGAATDVELPAAQIHIVVGSDSANSVGVIRHVPNGTLAKEIATEIATAAEHVKLTRSTAKQMRDISKLIRNSAKLKDPSVLLQNLAGIWLEEKKNVSQVKFFPIGADIGGLLKAANLPVTSNPHTTRVGIQMADSVAVVPPSIKLVVKVNGKTEEALKTAINKAISERANENQSTDGIETIIKAVSQSLSDLQVDQRSVDRLVA